MSIRRTPARRAVLVCVVLLILATAPALALSTEQGRTSARRQAQPALVVTVRPVSGLYPGRTRPLTVTFRNNATFDVTVASATTSSPGSPGCPAGNLTLTSQRFRPPLVIGAGRSRTATIGIGLRDTAGPRCQASHFTIRVTARAVRK
jgi:hypothetical protein